MTKLSGTEARDEESPLLDTNNVGETMQKQMQRETNDSARTTVHEQQMPNDKRWVIDNYWQTNSLELEQNQGDQSLVCHSNQ